MTVTAIKAAIKTKGRFNIFVDGEYAFSLDESQLIDSGVRVGREYTEAEIAALQEENTFGKAYVRALDYILRRVRSEQELRDYARRKQWEPALSQRVIAKLKAKGYLDDTKFAQAWVRHRALGKPTSQRKLRLELKQKGVSDDIINHVLSESNEFNELSALRQLVAKKRSRYNDEQKFIAYLARLGFSFDDIKAVLGKEL